MSDNKNIGCGLSGMTFGVLLILKLAGAISISWNWVFAALFIDIILAMGAVIIAVIVASIIAIITNIFE